MAYRLCFFDDQNILVKTVLLVGSTDDAAWAEAQSYASRLVMELWSEDRLIERFLPRKSTAE